MSWKHDGVVGQCEQFPFEGVDDRCERTVAEPRRTWPSGEERVSGEHDTRHHETYRPRCVPWGMDDRRDGVSDAQSSRLDRDIGTLARYRFIERVEHERGVDSVGDFGNRIVVVTMAVGCENADDLRITDEFQYPVRLIRGVDQQSFIRCHVGDEIDVVVQRANGDPRNRVTLSRVGGFDP